MKPTISDYYKSSATWRREHRNVTYNLSHHGISDYSPEGTWCYYLFLQRDMFQNADDFALFDKPAKVEPSFGDKLWQTYDYYDIPDLDFHGGVTWYSKEPYFDRATGLDEYALKIGCDYAHSWDRDGGFWQGIEEIARDAMRSINILADTYPLNDRCKYSGILDAPENFYTAVNGSRVHKSQADKIDPQWEGWKPA